MDYEKFNNTVANISKLQQLELEKIALSTISELDGILKRAKSADADQRKAGNKDRVLAESAFDLGKEQEAALKNKVRFEKILVDRKKDAQKMIDTAEQDVTNAAKANTKAIEKHNDKNEEWLKQNRLWGQEMKRAWNVAGQLDNALERFEKAAKDLGFDTKGKTKKYQSAIQSIGDYYRQNYHD